MLKRDRLLELVKSYPGMSAGEYAGMVGRPRPSVDRDLRVLRDKGKVRMSKYSGTFNSWHPVTV